MTTIQETSEPKEKYLIMFPLSFLKGLSLAELKTFELIWLKCCLDHKFDSVFITKRDKELIGLPVNGYKKGLEALAKKGLITTIRCRGVRTKISINENMIDEKAKSAVLKKRAT